jgi:1,4-dihydroxy-6-naphthoate synthase
MQLTLGFSPCPNDTFIFDALVNKKIDTEGLEVRPVLEDVQTLNEWALQGRLDITKISYGVLPLLLDKYIVLNAGGALGKGVGPLLIMKYDPDSYREGSRKYEEIMQDVDNMTIAIPGEHTTAHMLFSLAFPNATRKKFMVFSAIEDAVLQGEVDAGVIIHENRFTYQQKGLHKLMDLGEYWEQQTGNPIPLGGIVMKKTFDVALQQQVDKLIKRSLEYAFANYPLITDYVKQHSQEMSEEVMRQHIDLYVNNYSLQLGEEGKAAVHTFLGIYEKLKQIKATQQEIFLAV